MKWQDVARRMGRIAPSLGAAVGGPAGAAMGQVVARTLGVEPTPAAVDAALLRDPQAVVKLRELEVEIERAFLQDVQQARQIHAGHPMTWILPLVLIAGWFVLVWIMVYGEIPPETRDQFFIGFGSWSTFTAAGIGYWLSTSRGSAEKQQQQFQQQNSSARWR